MNSAHILIVDDDPGLAALLRTLLEDRGYEVDVAHSGHAAIASVTQRLPDLLLLDLRLGDMDAASFVEKLGQLGDAPPFVCISGQGDERSAVEMMKLGALEYLLKDTQLVHFVPAVIDKALEQIDMRRRLSLSEAERRRLEAELIEASERERRSIGHDLHDGLGQRLTALALISHALCEQLKADGSPRENTARQLITVAQQINTDLREAIGETRRLARGLSPITLEKDGLVSALQLLVENASRGSDIEIVFSAPGRFELGDTAVASHLYRIAQEALNNSMKHSGARNISVAIQRTPDAIELSVADDGVGFSSGDDANSGMGLRVMDYRARLIGAALEVRPSPHGGTTILCKLQNPA